MFDISTTTKIGTYLGTPIFSTHRKATAYQYLVDKIQRKIEGWQIKYLFVARRVTLIKSTSASILIHAMQTTLLSQKINRQINKLIVNSYGETPPNIGTVILLVGKPSLPLRRREVWVLNPCATWMWLCLWIRPRESNNSHPCFGLC